MHSFKLYWAAVPLLVLAACSAPHARKEGADMAYVETTEKAGDSTLELTDPSRKRMRTADVRMRVNDVYRASEKIEKLVRSLDGVVEESKQRNEYFTSQDLRYTPDSIKRVQLFSTTSDLKLRVPVASLDSVVYTLSSMASFIDYRTLSDTDATLQYLSNELKGGMTDAAVPLTRNDKAIDVMDRKQALNSVAVDRKIANLQIMDNVAYSTITVQLFQPASADIQVLVNPRAVTRNSLGADLLNAVRNGWAIVTGLLVVLIAVWPLWLLLGVGWMVYRRFRKSASL